MLQWVEDEADLPAEAAGPPRARSRKSGKKKGKGGKGGAGSEQPADEEPSGAELDRREIAAMEQILGNDPGWLAFSISTAKWVPFSVDPEMQRAFADTSYIGSNDETVARWMHRAETSVIHHIIHRIIEREKRADLFRALGRGWVFILLVRNQKKFKWWFEGVDRVLRNHQFDIMCLKLEEEGIEKYTRGYMCQSEIVFMMKGLVPHSNCPIICIMKMAHDFIHKKKWGASDEVQRAVMTPLPSDAERHAHAQRAQERKQRRQRAKERRALEASLEREGEATAPDESGDAPARMLQDPNPNPNPSPNLTLTLT